MVDLVNEAEAMAAVDGFTSSWLAHDIERKATFLTDDFVLWNNCYKVEVEKPVAVRFFNWLTTMMWNNTYYDVRRYLTPTGVIQQHLTSFDRSEEHTSELQSLMRISYAVFCLKKKILQTKHKNIHINNKK